MYSFIALEQDTIKEEVVTEDEYAEYRAGMRGSKHDKGTFWPEKPKTDPTFSGNVKASTVLTNLQRGNIPTIMQTVVEPVIMVNLHTVKEMLLGFLANSFV
jgi:hypothetical protein